MTQLKIDNDIFQTITDCDKNKITALRLKDSGIQTLPDLSSFTKLVTLDLCFNPIINLKNLEKVPSLKNLDLRSTNCKEHIIDFSKLHNLGTLSLHSNALWSEDLKNLQGLKDNQNLSIDLQYNSIIDASDLLVLDPSCKINLGYNVNLSQESKDALKARFGRNVNF